MLNWILDAVPVKLVISSAWRYLILRGDMTLKGFEYLLLVHGVDCKGRLHGYTDADVESSLEPSHFAADEWHRRGLKWRSRQVQDYVKRHRIDKWAVVDDLDLQVANFVRVGVTGLEWEDAKKLVALLKGETLTSK